jgi:hypothetical protein
MFLIRDFPFGIMFMVITGWFIAIFLPGSGFASSFRLARRFF